MWAVVAACWHEAPLERPSLGAVAQRLREVLEEMEEEGQGGTGAPRCGCACVVC